MLNVLIRHDFRLLGVLVTSSFSMDKYVDCILSVVTQRFYLLSQLKNQGLSIYVIPLNILFHALYLVLYITCSSSFLWL